MSFLAARRVRIGVLSFLAGVAITGGVVSCASSDQVTTPADDTRSTAATSVVSTTAGAEATSTTVTDTDEDGTTASPGHGQPGPDPDPSAPATVPTAPPLEPTGLFLNTHRLSLSGSGAPDAGHSVCQTSPGATCQIRFVADDGTSVALDARTVDETGVVTWNWSPSEVGLAVGDHRVEVIAVRGGHEVTATDARALSVIR